MLDIVQRYQLTIVVLSNKRSKTACLRIPLSDIKVIILDK